MKKIRIRFFILFTAVVVVFGIGLSLLYTYNLWESNKDYVKQSYYMLVDVHESHLKEKVNQAIDTIEGQRKNTETYYKDKLKELFQEPTLFNDPRNLSEWLKLNQTDVSYCDFFVWDHVQSKVIYKSEKQEDFKKFTQLKEFVQKEFYYEEKRVGDYSVIAYIKDELIEEKVTEYIHDLFHIYSKNSDDYLWVNKIVDYSGGDEYAIRLIEPNLADTEGEYISTDTQDKAGNYFYYNELEKIKLNGELLSSYYFKKMNSDEEEYKMSYGKLYREYDWVVSSGVYLDEIDSFIDEKRGRLYKNSLERLLSMALIMVAFITVMMLCVLLLEWYYTKNSIKQIASIRNKNKELENMAQEDTLTKLLNRRGAVMHLNSVFTRYKEEQIPVSIAMGDLDYFKKVNDTYGHDMGDIVLITVANVIKRSIRSDDVAIRWGGEEILIVFYNTCREEARNIVERVRVEIENIKIPFQGDEYISLTCSFGISAFYLKDKGYEEAVNRADKALYNSKQNGRNRITIYRDIHEDIK